MAFPKLNGWAHTIAILLTIISMCSVWGISGMRSFGRVEERIARVEERLNSSEKDISNLKTEGSLPVRDLHSSVIGLRQMLDQNIKDHADIKIELKEIKIQLAK